MTDYPPWLPAIAHAVGLSGTSLTWYGDVVAGDVINDAELVDTVTTLLYRFFYSVGTPMLQGTYTGRVTAAPVVDIARTLHAANAGSGRIDPGWRHIRDDESRDGQYVVAKHGLQLTAPGTVAADGSVAVALPAGSFARSQGFYVAHSEAPFTHQHSLSRLYLNTHFPYAADVMRRVTSSLNDLRIPFDFKIVNNLRGFYRCDNSVLYFYRRDYPTVMHRLGPDLTEAARRGYLQEGTPAMTRRISEGVAAADDPDNASSFGLHRCRVIAEGITATLGAAGDDRRADTAGAIWAAFLRYGLDINRPYLNDPRSDPYASD
jgi:hypothetical protein